MGCTSNIVIFLTILCISWSSQDDVNEVPSTTAAIPIIEGQDRLANAINNFGYKLITTMMKQNVNNNIVISPAGIAGLLAMTLLGSVGSTYDELAATLGFSQGRRPKSIMREYLVFFPVSSARWRGYPSPVPRLKRPLPELPENYSCLIQAAMIEFCHCSAHKDVRTPGRHHLDFGRLGKHNKNFIDILTNRQNHELFGELLQELNADTSSRTVYADAIFVDTRTQIRQVYRDYLQRVYHGDALAAHFGDGAKAKELINEWVKNNTNGKIEEFLKDPLSSNTRVVLINALYFSGQWAQPFLPDFTKKMTFKTPSGEVMADLMLNAGDFMYTHNEKYDVHMIALPYNDSTTTMYVMKPRLHNLLNLTDLMDRLDNTKINEMINQMTKKSSLIRFPKMELKSELNLEESLKNLGIKNIFNPVKANFALMLDCNEVVNKSEEELITRINSGDEEARGLRDVVDSLPNPGVHVDSVIHDVKMSINEYGTEAVAASSLQLARTAERFYADSPFYMFVRNEKTKLITFSAIINEPTVS